MINDDVRRFNFELNGASYQHFITGLMIVFSMLVIIGRIVNSDIWQAIDFIGKVLGIVCRSLSYGLFS
jgi:uncharacterized membrane protein YjgN (DUF898 family)